MSEIRTPLALPSPTASAPPEARRAAKVHVALVGLAGIALGYALGLNSSPPPTAAPDPALLPAGLTGAAPDAPARPGVAGLASATPGAAPDRPGVAGPSAGSDAAVARTTGPSAGSSVASPAPTDGAAAASSDSRDYADPHTREVLARLAPLDQELAGLARALARPARYRTARAVLDDLAAYDAALRRREALARALPGEPHALPPAAELPPGLRDRVSALERAGAIGLAVRGTPTDVTYAPVPAPGPAGQAELTVFAGVALGSDARGPRIAWRTVRGDVERRVEVSEDPRLGRDVLRVEYAEKDGPVRLTRTSELGPAGQSWSWFAERLWARGSVEHDELEQLVSRPLSHPPRPGWIDWLRRHLDLPRNSDLGEEFGPAPPLPRTNPLLLSSPGVRPAVLERADLVVDPDRCEPPLSLAGRGPFVLLAANAVGVYDTSWRWVVFDTAKRRVVDHAELTSGEVENVRWELLPDPERFPQLRRGDLTNALLATALERTRQAIALVALPGEVVLMSQELKAKEGCVLTADGLEALRLRGEVLDRMRRLDALGHLLLDEDGVSYYERLYDRGKIETTSELVEVIARMIEAGHDGPAEFLMRDDRVTAILFRTNKSERDRLRQLFRERFRPWGVRFRRSISGETTHWYEEPDGG